MATLSQFDKPDAGQYREKRKLFLVPSIGFGRELEDDLQALVDRFWSEVRDHVNNLERSLGAVKHVYHEMLYAEGDEGLRIIEMMNPGGHGFIQALIRSTASLEATEDMEIFGEYTDWQRCLSMGLMSQKVNRLASEGYRESLKQRYEHIASRIDETLGEAECAVLFVQRDHSIQFPPGVQVFYVAPPSLNAIDRWFDDRMREMSRAASAQATQGLETGGES
jgi:hypothetical protein